MHDGYYSLTELREILDAEFPIASERELEALAITARHFHMHDPELTPAECCAQAWEARHG